MTNAGKLALLIALFCWSALFLSFEKDRSRYRNCYFLFFALGSTLFAATFFTNEKQGETLYAIVLIIAAALLMVPVFLIHNGIVMYKREGHSLANLLSLLFGIVIAV